MRLAAAVLSFLIVLPSPAAAAVAVRPQSKASAAPIPRLTSPAFASLNQPSGAPILKQGPPVLTVNPSPVVGSAIEAGLTPSADLGSESQSAVIGQVFDGLAASKAELGTVEGGGGSFRGPGLLPSRDHSRGHSHGPPGFWEKPPEERPKYVKALWTSLAVGGVFFLVELIGSMMTGSLALRADAVHLAVDLSVIAAALFAWWKKDIPKIEPIVGLLSSVLIGGTALHMGFEAWERFQAPQVVGGLSTMVLATAGLASNVITTLLLYKHRQESLSMKAAFLHALADAMGSVGIIASGALTLAFGWRYADPVMAVIIAAIVAKTTWTLARNSIQGLRRGPGK